MTYFDILPDGSSDTRATWEGMRRFAPDDVQAEIWLACLSTRGTAIGSLRRCMPCLLHDSIYSWMPACAATGMPHYILMQHA